MAPKNWTLADLQQDIYVEQIALGPDNVGGAASGYSVVKRTLKTGLSQGVDVIEVNNGAFRFVVLPTRGKRCCRSIVRLAAGSIQGPVRA